MAECRKELIGHDNQLHRDGLLGCLCALRRASRLRQRRTAARREITGPRLPHPALSSQSQVGGGVYAEDSGAVSIISSIVTGCSAGEMRRIELAALQRRTAAGLEMERATAASPRLAGCAA